jgi:xanthine dehydrogenase accessory factor
MNGSVREWPAEVARVLSERKCVVRIVVGGVRGSAPRDIGTCMIVTPTRTIGTIGGGHLEYTAIDVARRMFDSSSPALEVQSFVLGADLAQCCGGVVELLFERYVPADLICLQAMAQPDSLALEIRFNQGTLTRTVLKCAADPLLTLERERVVWKEPLHLPCPNVWVFGAGHVGQALVRVLETLPVAVTCIDSRPAFLPQGRATSIHAADPLATLAQVRPGTHFIVVTHDHALDYALCRAILERGDAAFLGVIGSSSKAARFRSRLAREGIMAESIRRLTCPIGIGGIHGKDPAVLAIAVTAQLLRAFEALTRPIIPVVSERSVLACAPQSCAGCDSPRYIREGHES